MQSAPVPRWNHRCKAFVWWRAAQPHSPRSTCSLAPATHTHMHLSHTATYICVHFQSVCVLTHICYAFSHWRTGDRFSALSIFNRAVAQRFALALRSVHVWRFSHCLPGRSDHHPLLTPPFIYSLAPLLVVVAAVTQLLSVVSVVVAGCTVMVLINE